MIIIIAGTTVIMASAQAGIGCLRVAGRKELIDSH